MVGLYVCNLHRTTSSAFLRLVLRILPPASPSSDSRSSPGDAFTADAIGAGWYIDENCMACIGGSVKEGRGCIIGEGKAHI